MTPMGWGIHEGGLTNLTLDAWVTLRSLAFVAFVTNVFDAVVDAAAVVVADLVLEVEVSI